jgi:hypothetical protein
MNGPNMAPSLKVRTSHFFWKNMSNVKILNLSTYLKSFQKSQFLFLCHTHNFSLSLTHTHTQFISFSFSSLSLYLSLSLFVSLSLPLSLFISLYIFEENTMTLHFFLSEVRQKNLLNLLHYSKMQ